MIRRIANMKLLLDTNIINGLVEKPELPGLFNSLKEFADAEIFVCYSIVEEISAIPDLYIEKRKNILSSLFKLEPKIIYDGVAILGETTCGTAVVSEGEVFQRIVNDSRNNLKDAIIAETAVNNNLTLVTNDIDLYNKMKANNYDVVNTEELANGKTVLNKKYPLLEQNYISGFVCYFDILGFGSFTQNEANLDTIKKLIVNLKQAININEQNHFIGNIAMFSDSFFFTVSDDEMREAGFFTSIIDFVCMARDIIQHHIHTDIRAGIVYGNYIHLKNNAIFGPAITQSVRLAEPKKERDPLKLFLTGDPAAIIIHPNVLESPLNKYRELERILTNNKRYIPLGDSGYYVVNPYYFIYDTRSIGSLLYGQIINKEHVCEEWKNHLMANEPFPDFSLKYRMSLQFLEDFKNDKNVE